jgi:hypothetical protein
MKRTLRVEKFSLQKAAGGGSILDAHFASGWVNFRALPHFWYKYIESDYRVILFLIGVYRIKRYRLSLRWKG